MILALKMTLSSLSRGSFFAIALLVVAFANPAYGQCPGNTNLILNPDAEQLESGPWIGNQDHNVPEWTDTPTSTYGLFTVIPYALGGGFPTASSPGPPDRGLYFFSGGPSSQNAFAEQVRDVSACAALIDTGNLQFSAEGYFGGFAGQNDRAQLDIVFRDASNGFLQTRTIGLVTAAARGNTTGLLLRSGTGTVPVGTRNIVFRLAMTQQSGDNDGYADNLDFRFLVPTAAEVSIGGRVVDRVGRSVLRATVSITDQFGNFRSVQTNPFGFFRFDGIEAGQAIVLEVRHKTLTFEPQLIVVNDSLDDLLLVANGAVGVRTTSNEFEGRQKTVSW